MFQISNPAFNELFKSIVGRLLSQWPTVENGRHPLIERVESRVTEFVAETRTPSFLKLVEDACEARPLDAADRAAAYVGQL